MNRLKAVVCCHWFQIVIDTIALRGHETQGARVFMDGLKSSFVH